MCVANREIPVAVEGIAGTKAADLLLECNRFIDRTGRELALAEIGEA
jgi:hypothetical protein